VTTAIANPSQQHANVPSVGCGVGDTVGDVVGEVEGDFVGVAVGCLVGSGVGEPVGEFVGDRVGELVGDSVGERVGDSVGDSVGERVGDSVGERVGDSVGERVGDSVGERVGERVGDAVGTHSGVFKRTGKHSCPMSVIKHSWLVHASVSCSHTAVQARRPSSSSSSSPLPFAGNSMTFWLAKNMVDRITMPPTAKQHKRKSAKNLAWFVLRRAEVRLVNICVHTKTKTTIDAKQEAPSKTWTQF